MAIFRFEIESEDREEMRDLLGALFFIGGGGVVPEVAAAKPARATGAKKAATATVKEIEPEDAPVVPETLQEPEEKVISKPTAVEDTKPVETKPAPAAASDVTLEMVKAKGTELMPHLGGATGVIAFLKETTKAHGGKEIGGYGSLPEELYAPVHAAMENKLADLLSA